MDINAYEQKVKRLEFQNKRLSEKVEVQKAEAAHREKTITEQSKRWTAAQSAVLAVRRGWTQLHEDLKDCAIRMGLRMESSHMETGPLILDPLVEALLAPAKDMAMIEEVRRNVQAMSTLTEDTDNEIKQTSEETMRMFVQLMDQQPALTGGQEEEAEWKVLKRVLNERVRTAEDKLARRETELQDVRNLLADSQIELENAQRKILSYKNDPIRQESSTTRSTGESSKTPTVKSQEGNKRGEDDEASLKALHQTCIDSLIQSKIEELEKERTERIRLQKHLRTMELEMKGEEWVYTTRLYKTLMERHDRLLQDLDRKTRETEGLHQALETKERELNKKQKYDPEAFVHNYETLKGLQKKLGELQTLIDKSDQSRNEMEKMTVSLQGPTIEEFNQLLRNAQNETTRLRKRLKESVDDAERVEKARKETIEAGKRMRTAESGMEHLKERIQELEDSKAQLTRREEQLTQSKEDLKVFVEVLSTIECVDKTWKESESRAREQNVLRENSSLKRKIEDLEGRRSRDEITSKDLHNCKRKIEKLTSRLERASKDLEEITRRNKHNEEDLCQQKQLNAALEEELEVSLNDIALLSSGYQQTGAAYEEMQAQSGRLLEQVANKDNTIVDLRHQITKSTQKISVLTSLVENLEASAAVNEGNSLELEQIKEAFEGRISDLQEEISNLRAEVVQLEENVHRLYEDMTKKESEIQELHHRCTSGQRTIEDYKRTAEDEIEKLLHERTKRQRLEADVKAFEDLKKKLRTGTVSSSDFTDQQDVAILNQENENLRQALTCSVCLTRFKSVILTKCMHTFCKTCIDNRIETRSRRCPGCGSAFSREEVRQFYLS